MSQHIASTKFYVFIYAILVGMLVATVAVAHVNLGDGNLPVALLIAGFKAVLIVLFFMHVKDAPKLVWIFSGAAFLWLGILLALTMMDYLTRDWLSILGK